MSEEGQRSEKPVFLISKVYIEVAALLSFKTGITRLEPASG